MTIALIKCCKSKVHPKMVYNLYYQHYYSQPPEDEPLKKAESVIPDGKAIPEAPTTCCMTGCPNCVWLDYAQKLTEHFKDGGEKAIEEINTHVTDPNVRAYLMHELRMRNNT